VTLREQGERDQSTCLEVSRTDHRDARLVSAALRPAEQGEVVFEVERFGLSANNITYALLGDELQYWDLFPADPGWGRIPVWGYLRAVDSAVPGIEPGSRAFGLCPMATHVVMRPARVGTATFVEESPHRAGLSSVYNVYARATAGPHDHGTPGDDALMILRPVFWLSFTLDHYLTARVPRGRPVIVTSASSKASIGLAHLLAARGVSVTGLTSERHAAFVRSLNLYQRVLPYDKLCQVPAAGAVLVDISGKDDLRDRIQAHAAGRLAEVIVAGATHGTTGHGAARPAGWFFAPDLIRRLAADWGWPVLEQRFQAALAGFAATASWLRVIPYQGTGGLTSAYRQVLDNMGSPADAHLVIPASGP
jgi:hypothetical protein